MKTTHVAAKHTPTSDSTPLMGSFLYKTISIYPKFADVGVNLALLNSEGFTNDQISLLGREQEHWQENLEYEWNALKTAKSALGGAALGSIPGLAIIAGIALTGGVGLLAAGPLVVAMSTLGFGALGGGLMGVGWNAVDADTKLMHVGEEVEDAISQGKWVLIVHSHDEAEAMRAHKLLVGSRTVRENESK